MSDLELLPHMYAPLQLMFADHCVEMELKAAQRQRVRERRASTPSLVPGTHTHKRCRLHTDTSDVTGDTTHHSRNHSNEPDSTAESTLPGIDTSQQSKSKEKVSLIHSRKFSTDCVETSLHDENNLKLGNDDCMEQDGTRTNTNSLGNNAIGS